MGSIRLCTGTNGLLRLVLVAAVAAASVAESVEAQGVYQGISNSVLTAGVGVSGTENGSNAAGRFFVREAGATGGTLMRLPIPAVPPRLATPGSYVTIRIDGGTKPLVPPATVQTEKGWDLIFGDVIAGTLTAAGAWLVQPTVSGNRIIATWRTLPGAIAPPLNIPPIEVDLVMSIVYDVVSYEFKVRNMDTVPHSVGLRFAQDFQVPGSVDGPVIAPGAGTIFRETDIGAGQIPPFWRAYDGSNARTVGATLSSGATIPNRLTFGDAETVLIPLWAFTPNPARDFTGTTVSGASGVYFSEVLVPGQTTGPTFRTYFGRNHATINFGPQLDSGVDGPLSLTFDSAAPAGSQLKPDPFEVKAFARNHVGINLTGVRATLTLPEGWTTPGQNLTSAPTTVVNGETAEFTWSVKPAGTASGRLSYTVSFSSSEGPSASVAREIDIPALPVQSFPVLQQVSFPYVFADDSPAVAFGLSNLDFNLLRWNQTQGQYEAVSALVPGEGYWLNNLTTAPINLVGATPVSSAGGQYEIRLKNGWNQIGNPFLLRVRWGDVLVRDRDGVEAPLPVSVAGDLHHNWILPTFYPYNTAHNGNPASPPYFFSGLNDDLVPFQGAWVKSLKNSISLIIPAPIGRSASVNRTAVQERNSATNWAMRLMVTGSAGAASTSHIGLSTTASDGYDLKDIEQPPPFREGLLVSLVRDNWGGRSASYVKEIQAASGGRKSWKLRVSSEAANQEVVLSWPDMGIAPRSYEFYVVDEATGHRQMMRQTSSLRVNTGDSSTRSLTIVAEPKTAAGAFRFTNWRVVSRGPSSATIGFVATADANVRIRIMRGSGSAVRSLVTRAVSSGSETQLNWDYKDAKGVSVPAGAYTIELRGSTPDGQSATVIIPHIVVR